MIQSSIESCPSRACSGTCVLDANKLRDSLTTLLHTGNWRKLRGRLRLDDQNKLYITIPAVANKQRPATRFRHTVLGQPIDSHPLANQLAQPNPRSSVQEAIMGFTKGDISSFITPPDWPRNMAEYVDPDRDEPIVGLHVLSFTDATLVVVNFSHVMMDGGGIESLISAWSTVLSATSAGTKFTIPDISLTDPFSTLRNRITTNNPAIEPFVLHDRTIASASLMPEDGAAPTTDPDWDTSSPGSRWRTFSVSASAQRNITAEARSTAPNGVFVSEDDAVMAWIIRTVSSTYPAQRPINAMRMYNTRGRLPGVFKDMREMGYIQNAYQFAWSLFDTAGQTHTGTLGDVAVELRRSIQQQLTPEQVVAATAGRVDGDTPMYGSPVGVPFLLNSWAKMDVYRIADFSAAVVEDERDSSGDEGKEEMERGGVVVGGKGKPELIDVDFDMGAPPPGPNFTCSGKEARTGMRYTTGYLVGRMWETFERELEKLEEGN